MRRFSILCLAAALVTGLLSLTGCGAQEPASPQAEPFYFEAVVLEANGGNLLVEPAQGTDERASADQIQVNAAALDDADALEPGDRVRIGYGGSLPESDPAQITDAFSVELLERQSKTRMVRVDGALYYDTGRQDDQARCGVMDGAIESSVPRWEVPQQDDQSNFGAGYGYQRGPEGVIEVNIDGVWCAFAQRED